MKRHEHYRTIQSIQRYGEDLEETTLHFDRERKTSNIGKTKQEEDISTLGGAIVEFLSSQNEPVIESVIMEEVEGRTGLKRKALREMVKGREVTREGKGGKGDPFKYSYFHVPTYIGEQENENPEITATPYNHNKNTCSQNSEEIKEIDKSREQAFPICKGIQQTERQDKCSQCSGVVGCMMTEGQRELCDGHF